MNIKLWIVWLAGFVVATLAPLLLFSALIIPQTITAMLAVFIMSVCIGSLIGVICGSIFKKILEDNCNEH